MKRVSVIGAGRVGTSLGRALIKAGYPLAALSCAALEEAEDSFRLLGEGEPTNDNILAAGKGDLIFITVPDDAVPGVARELSEADIPWVHKTVFHSSGLLPSSVLESLAALGAATASFHPIQSFPDKNTGPDAFRNIYVSLEGSSDALLSGERIVRNLGAHPLRIHPKDKAVFHTAFSIASNFLVVLLDSAFSLLQSTGIDEKEAAEILKPLLEGTLKNITGRGPRKALTGPVIRGDTKTIEAHLLSLERFPEEKNIYRQMARKAIMLAKKEGALSESQIKDLCRILEEK